MQKIYVLSVTTSNHDSPEKENLGVFSTLEEASEAGKEYGKNILIEVFTLGRVPTKNLEYIVPVY